MATKDLTNCEKMIMKVVWDAEGDIATQQVIKQLKERYGKDYARTTVVTFVQRLIEKGYVTTNRIGRVSYVHAVESEKEYRKRMLSETVDFWFQGDVPELVSALCSAKEVSKEDVDKMKKIINGMNV